MNTQETVEMRDLTATELDEVSGGGIWVALGWLVLMHVLENTQHNGDGPGKAQVIDISQVL
jgi:hypothetical protein